MAFKEILTDLVKIKSFSGEEEEIAEYIFNYLKRITGVNVFRQEGNVIAYVNSNNPASSNNVGSNINKKNNCAKNCLIFNAHLDTVKPGEEKLWFSNPFELVEKEGKYFGLGVSDEKVSAALLLEIIPEIINRKSSIDIFFIFVVNEEKDGSGSESFVKYFLENHHYETISAIICEPTNAEFMELGKKGNIFLEIAVEGKSAHSSIPENGLNAIESMFSVLKKLKELVSNLEEQSIYLGKTTLAAPTTIAGGSSINKIPDNCKATADIRTIPETHDFILELLEEELVAPNVTVKLYSKPTPPSLTNEKEYIVKLLEELGVTKKVYGCGSDDSVFFTQKGIPCVVFGAGTKEAIHRSNEYVEIKNIAKTKQIYLDLINNFGNNEDK